MTADWLAAARAWPVAFAQVREDPLVDLALADRLSPDSSVLMVASGGCTAACLARHRAVKRVHLVDANPAQMALTRLKLHLLDRCTPEERMSLLGHAPMEADTRLSKLERCFDELGLGRDAIGAAPQVAHIGPDYAGRYEQLFVALQETIRSDPVLHCGMNDLLALNGAAEQRSWLGQNVEWQQKLSIVFNRVLVLDNLVALFGEGATRNPRLGFAEHFFSQFIDLAHRLPLSENPFAWQMLRGRFPHGMHALWLSLPARRTEAAVSHVVKPMEAAMRDEAATGWGNDLVHLSNILDWLDEPTAMNTLQAAWECARSGAWIVVRQLNSTLDIRALGARIGWKWDIPLSNALLAADRSFFYRELHVGRKP
jgi:S-adenosylmethionine-diacylglycerol 3-amino-3-carboxypropyl transferase